MAIKFDHVEVTRGEELRLYPEDIVVDADANGRANLDDTWVAGHSPESIQEMVDSYNRMGQQQPVQIRKVAGKPKLVSGHRRWAGAMEYNRQHPDARMKLRCTLTNLNDEEAFERNVEENTVRSGLTPMDQAYNHRRFREMLGWPDNPVPCEETSPMFAVRDIIEVTSVHKANGADVTEKRTGIVTAVNGDLVCFTGHHVDDRLTTGSGAFNISRLGTTKYGLHVGARVIGKGSLPMDGFWTPQPGNSHYDPMM